MLNNNRRAFRLGLIAVVLWSTAATAFKLALAELDVFQLLAVAVPTSALALVMLLVTQGRGSELATALRSQPLYFLALGGLNPLLYYAVLLHAYQLLPAQQAQTINYTWAIALAVLSIPFLGQRLAARDWLAVALGYLGVVIIATEGEPFALNFSSPLGVALALASTLVWAVFWLLNARSKTDPIVVLSALFLCAAPLSLVACACFGAGLPPLGQGLWAAFYVGLFEMGITWLLWSEALRSTANVSRIGNLIFLSPLLSLVLIATVLGEPIHPATLLGFAFIIPGIVVQQRARPAKGKA